MPGAGSFDGHAFRQIAWLIDVTPTPDRDVVGQQLQGQHQDQRLQQIRDVGHIQDVLGMLFQRLIALRANGNDDAVPRLDLLQVGDDFIMHAASGCQDDHRHLLIDERDRAVFHLAPSIALSMDVG